MATERSARVRWQGDLMSGSGEIAEVPSGTFGPLQVSWTSRAEEPGGKTSPEELLAAAHAACFSMALAVGLESSGKPATSVETRAACTVEKVGEGFKITTMKLDVRAKVPNIEKTAFQQVLEGAKKGCPVSNALAGVKIEVQAQLV